MKTIRISDSAYEHLSSTVWSAVIEPFSYFPSWWDTIYVTPGNRLFVCTSQWAADEEPQYPRRRIFTRRQLVETYLNITDPTHCGGYNILSNPDACAADIILQHAFFGRIIFG